MFEINYNMPCHIPGGGPDSQYDRTIAGGFVVTLAQPIFPPDSSFFTCGLSVVCVFLYSVFTFLFPLSKDLRLLRSGHTGYPLAPGVAGHHLTTPT